MAKPIQATPILRGKDAERFVKQLIKEEKTPSKARVNFIRNALSMKGYFSRFL